MPRSSSCAAEGKRFANENLLVGGDAFTSPQSNVAFVPLIKQTTQENMEVSQPSPGKSQESESAHGELPSGPDSFGKDGTENLAKRTT